MKELTNIQQQILDGALLGDGHLELHKHCKNACFRYLSSSKEHTQFIHKFFKDFCSQNYQNVKTSTYFDKRTNKSYTRYYFKTKCLPVFTTQQKRFYFDRIKFVPNELKLTPNLLLAWYLGDGELESKYGYVKLHTNSFTEDEIDYLCALLSNFNARKTKKEGVFIITIPRSRVRSFLDYIGDCPIQDYKHKWSFVEYKNKNIEVNGISNHSDKYESVIKDWLTNSFTIYSLGKKYNIPIKAIKNYFDNNSIKWKPKITLKSIVQYNLKNEFIKDWNSGQDIAKELSYNASAISECCRGIRKQYKGFIWKFKNKEI